MKWRPATLIPGHSKYCLVCVKLVETNIPLYYTARHIKGRGWISIEGKYLKIKCWCEIEEPKFDKGGNLVGNTFQEKP